MFDISESIFISQLQARDQKRIEIKEINDNLDRVMDSKTKKNTISPQTRLRK
jgi:hypothetical protein